MLGRRQTGLRNRRRTGRSQYSIRRKAELRDSYGAWSNGRQERADVVAGRNLVYRNRWEEI